MPVYQLTAELVFPNPEWANPEGLLAVGGDLSLKRLLLAYQLGIFPWYSDDSPILWWSPPAPLCSRPGRVSYLPQPAPAAPAGALCGHI